ncbi:uncharacterized protein LOC116202573 isoform X2 [Punica granatum]|uniref:Uncharacterized protein LOC116202573 isoform X2 n=2 Tax=Punica granatum TaxID=22663 RepID=A0A6P8D6B6_PUNGR|nr:uncharacterized protein LOC116202573 isoform X2 [Punica granatum]PKI50698.1 hypothetical protein CRG98_028840 [Punica granatum]
MKSREKKKMTTSPSKQSSSSASGNQSLEELSPGGLAGSYNAGGSSSSMTTWTDEKHTRFLRSLEASFLQALRLSCRSKLSSGDNHLQLQGQFVPGLLCCSQLADNDIARTTTCSYSKSRRRKSPAKIKATATSGMMQNQFDGGARKRSRRPPSDQSHSDSSDDDQVVPEMNIITADKDDKHINPM